MGMHVVVAKYKDVIGAKDAIASVAARSASPLTASRFCGPRPTNPKIDLPSTSREVRTQRAQRMQRLRSMKISG